MAKAKRQIPPLKPEDKGKCFTRAALGLGKADFRKSDVTVKNERYLFITINNERYLNELHADGVVHEPRSRKELIDYDLKAAKTHKGRHIMVRFLNKGNLEYEYIGDELHMIRYDLNRHKIFVV